MVSYIYSYDEGIKGKNVGFARIESRNGQCKILVNIKGINTGNNHEQEVYFFRREGEKLIGIRLGNFRIKNGNGEFREVTNSENIKNSGYGISSVGGVLIRSSLDFNKILASGWDDKTLLVNNFVSDYVVASNLEEKETFEETKKETYISQEIPEGKREKTKEVELNEVELEVEVEVEVEEKMEAATVKEITGAPWEKLCASYNNMKAFEDETHIISLKINLKDIEKLPKKNWPLVNNSFLLHGYYSYRYLILANLDPNQSKDYIIGIPGIYHPNEKFVASMFGFEYFKPARKCDIKTGQFGYWYTKVKEN